MQKDIFCSLDASFSFFQIGDSFKIFIFFMSVIPLYFFFLLIKKSRFMGFLIFFTGSFFIKNSFSGENLRFKGLGLILSSIFFFLLFSKIFGLFPYNYGFTTQALSTFAISFVFWFGLNLSNRCFKFVSYLAHLTPSGSPLPLVFFLKILELISNVIRSFTLCLRLTIKITAGHILLTLMRIMFMKLFFSNSLLGSRVLLIFRTSYMIFEFFVCILQAFVFCLLLNQYTGEHRIL